MKKRTITELRGEDLSEVLVEFYQRGQGEAKSLAPPPPFEVTTSVVQTRSSKMLEPPKRDDPPPVVVPSALIGVENEADFYVGTTSGAVFQPQNLFQFNFYIRAHNQDKIVRGPVYIRTYNNYWQAEIPNPGGPPRYGQGPASLQFSGSTWNLPAPNEYMINVGVNAILIGLPEAFGSPFYGNLYVNMYIEYADDGEDFEHIYGYDGAPWWIWYYPPPRSIGAQMSFAY